MIIAIAAGKSAHDIFDGTLRENGDAVVTFLAMDRAIIAEIFEAIAREGFVLRFDFLKTRDIGISFFQPGAHGIEAGFDGIDVPGRYLHGGASASLDEDIGPRCIAEHF